jgi:hypothetical protein
MTKKVQFIIDFDADVEDYLDQHFKGYVDYRIINQSLDARGALLLLSDRHASFLLLLRR